MKHPGLTTRAVQLDGGRLAGIYLEDGAIAEAIDLPMKADGDADQMRFLGEVGPGGISNIRFHATKRSLPGGGTSLIADQAMATSKRTGELEETRPDGRLALSGTGTLEWGVQLPDSFTIAARVRYKTGTMSQLDLGNGLAIHLGHDEVGEPSTGSLPGLDEVTTHLMAAGAWFNLEAMVERNGSTTAMAVMLNGVPLSNGSVVVPDDQWEPGTRPTIQMQSGELEFAELRILDRP